MSKKYNLFYTISLVLFMSVNANASYDFRYTDYKSDSNTHEYRPMLYSTWSADDNNSNSGNTSGWDDDLYDLPHSYYFGWKIDTRLDLENTEIESATITFENIFNWTEETYDLWVTLFDVGVVDDDYVVFYGNDSQNEQSNYFSGQGVELAHFDNINNPLPTSSTTEDAIVSLDLTDENIKALIADGTFGLGVDPDCHFYNDGIVLTITTKTSDAVPEPSTMLLFGTGLASLAGVARRRQK